LCPRDPAPQREEPQAAGAPARGGSDEKVIWMSARQSAIPRSGFWQSFSYAGYGVWYVVRTQRNMRVHLLAGTAAILAGLALGISAADWACVLAVIGLVLTAETLNTVVEALTDLCTAEFHPLAKIAKDTAAGAVLISSVAALGVGIAVFLPRLINLA
jgi:diacylglycerol kinase